MDNSVIFRDAIINFKKVFFSIPGKNIKDIKQFFKKNNNYKKKIIPTYGFQSFPTNYNDLRLSFLKDLKSLSGNVCYADHTSSNSIGLNLLIISKSIQQGANYIEKHVTVDRFKNYPDSESSLMLINLMKCGIFKTGKIKSKLSRWKKNSVDMKKYAVLKKKIKKN